MSKALMIFGAAFFLLGVPCAFGMTTDPAAWAPALVQMWGSAAVCFGGAWLYGKEGEDAS